METVVLITGAGAPGIKGTLFSLKNNFDGRKIRSVGVDVNDNVVGKHLCDSFHQVPLPNEESFIPRFIEICEMEKAGVILPQTTNELFKLSEYKKEFEKGGIKVAVSGRRAIDLSNNKNELMKTSRKLGLPTAEFYLVDRFSDLEKYSRRMGWPDKPVVIKPPVSSGMRGLRIINEKMDRKARFYSEKPDQSHITMEELRHILDEKFPEILVMEFLPGTEYSVDMLTASRTVTIPRSRDLIRTGITFNGTVEKNDTIIANSEKLAREIDLEYAYGFQFKLDESGAPKIIESNPRIQGSMVISTHAGANIIYGAVKHALGEQVPDFKIKWGTKFMRYWGGITIIDDKKKEMI